MTADCWSARGARAVQGLALRLKINACVVISLSAESSSKSAHTPGGSATGGLHGV